MSFAGWEQNVSKDEQASSLHGILAAPRKTRQNGLALGLEHRGIKSYQSHFLAKSPSAEELRLCFLICMMRSYTDGILNAIRQAKLLSLCLAAQELVNKYWSLLVLVFAFRKEASALQPSPE